MSALSGCSGPDAHPLTPAAAADLEDIHNHLTEHHPDWARPTVIEIVRLSVL